MEKFSYADEFNRVADVARLSDADDVRISYSVFVGDPNSEGEDNFLGEEFFSADDFTTWSDAAKAKQLVVITLRKVDENLLYGLKLSDVRDEVLAAIDSALKEDNCYRTPRAVKAEVRRAVAKIFNYYLNPDMPLADA